MNEPVPDGPWDLIHERLVLMHLPEREAVLDRLVSALAPGGRLLIEDFDNHDLLTIDRDGPHHDLIVKILRAFNELLRQRGAVSNFAAGGVRHLRDRGLADTGAVAGSSSTSVGRPGPTCAPPTPPRCATASSPSASRRTSTIGTSRGSATPT